MELIEWHIVSCQVTVQANRSFRALLIPSVSCSSPALPLVVLGPGTAVLQCNTKPPFHTPMQNVSCSPLPWDLILGASTPQPSAVLALQPHNLLYWKACSVRAFTKQMYPITLDFQLTFIIYHFPNLWYNCYTPIIQEPGGFPYEYTYSTVSAQNCHQAYHVTWI